MALSLPSPFILFMVLCPVSTVTTITFSSLSATGCWYAGVYMTQQPTLVSWTQQPMLASWTQQPTLASWTSSTPSSIMSSAHNTWLQSHGLIPATTPQPGMILSPSAETFPRKLVDWGLFCTLRRELDHTKPQCALAPLEPTSAGTSSQGTAPQPTFVRRRPRLNICLLEQGIVSLPRPVCLSACVCNMPETTPQSKRLY